MIYKKIKEIFVGFFGNFFGGNKEQQDDSYLFEATPQRGVLKAKIKKTLKMRGFSDMEIKEIIDVIVLAEADIKIAEDSLAHVNINNNDPTRTMHAAIQDIKKYEKELAYNVRKKIMEIMARKRAVRGK